MSAHSHLVYSWVLDLANLTHEGDKGQDPIGFFKGSLPVELNIFFFKVFHGQQFYRPDIIDFG